jgi:Tfp pilus assembly protein FimV
MSKLRAMIGARLLPDTDPLVGQELPADPIAEAAMREAAAEADARRRHSVSTLHLLAAVVNQKTGPGARLLTKLGMNAAKARERFGGAL